jgi:hypothetical protein
MKLFGVTFAAMLMTLPSPLASAAATCESLSSLSLPETTITIAQTVAPGGFATLKNRSSRYWQAKLEEANGAIRAPESNWLGTR